MTLARGLDKYVAISSKERKLSSDPGAQTQEPRSKTTSKKLDKLTKVKREDSALCVWIFRPRRKEATQ